MLEDEFLKNRASYIRAMASKADPFIQRRLLDLAENYEGMVGKRPRELPVVRPLNTAGAAEAQAASK
jgi:hypothetical protein